MQEKIVSSAPVRLIVEYFIFDDLPSFLFSISNLRCLIFSVSENIKIILNMNRNKKECFLHLSNSVTLLI